MHDDDTDPWVEEPDKDAARIGKGRRVSCRDKEANWIDAKKVLDSTDNPNDLLRALRSGLDCLFVHPTTWWSPRPRTVPQDIWERAYFKDGKLWLNGTCLEGPHQKLVINRQQWAEHRGQLAAPAEPMSAAEPSASAPPAGMSPTSAAESIGETIATPSPAPVSEQSQNDVSPIVSAPTSRDAKRPLDTADDEIIRTAIAADYAEKIRDGEKPLNLAEIVTPVKRRLEGMGFYAARAKIGEIAHNPEFDALRERSGQTWKSKQKGKSVD
jgi:hypothetical protein